MTEHVTSVERDHLDLEKREREWRDLKARHADREKQQREEEKAALRDDVQFAARLRRNHRIPLTALIRDAGLSLDEAVRVEDLDWMSDQHARRLIDAVAARIKAMAEVARKNRRPRQVGTELAS